MTDDYGADATGWAARPDLNLFSVATQESALATRRQSRVEAHLPNEYPECKRR